LIKELANIIYTLFA